MHAPIANLVIAMMLSGYLSFSFEEWLRTFMIHPINQTLTHVVRASI